MTGYYVLKDDAINLIVAGLMVAKDGQAFLKPCEDLNGLLNNPQKLGRELRRINEVSAGPRYPDPDIYGPTDKEGNLLPYHYKRVDAPAPLYVCRELSNWLYQSDCDNNQENELYQLLRDYNYQLTVYIIRPEPIVKNDLVGDPRKLRDVIGETIAISVPDMSLDEYNDWREHWFNDFDDMALRGDRGPTVVRHVLITIDSALEKIGLSFKHDNYE
jgi:hypothetical protein